MAFPPEVAAALSGASVRQLSYWRWAKSDEPLLAPEFHEPRSRVSYSFRDVVALRALFFCALAGCPCSAWANREAILADLMGRIGLVQRRQRAVGSWMIDDEPLDEGVGWQDWPASLRLAASRRVRIRVRVTAPGAPTQEIARVRKVVEHEYRIMSRLAHDGLLQPLDFVDDELGVGLVYPYDESFQRLDLWQADRPQGVPLPDQLALLRQVAEAAGYAHRHGVVHRGLNPFTVSVKEPPGSGLG